MKMFRAPNLKNHVRRLAFMPVLILLAFAAAAIPAGCGGGDSSTAGKALPLKNVNDTLAKHSEVIKAAMRRNTIYKPAATLFTNATDGQNIGTFAIPQIGIKDRLIEGTTDADIAAGGAHVENSALPGMGGNFVVAGDRVLYSAPLLRAEQLEPGDEIKIEMPYGSFTYRVESLTTIEPEDTDILKPKGYDTVMFSTCDPLWQISTRIIVSAKLVNSEAKA